MKNTEYILKSKRVILDGEVQEVALRIKNGKIEEIITSEEKWKASANNLPFQDLENAVVMAGLIDSHVHINEPGRTEWEGFNTATKSAAAGGITTLVDMPLNATPVTVNAKDFEIKLQATKGKLHVNCGFWGGIVPENQQDLPELITKGILGIKAFLTHSGIDDFPNVTENDLHKSMALFAKNEMPLLVHCELDAPHEAQKILTQNPSNYIAYLNSRPREWEDNAVALMIRLCEKYNCHVHIVHLSSSDSIAQLQKAKAKGLPITVETCPHYLTLCAEEIPNGNTLFKCAPPIRERENNDQLWEALRNGLIDFVVTDHSPATPQLKRMDDGNLEKAWGGIASVQFSLPVFWTEAQKRGFSISDMQKLMSENVASVFKIANKGKISKGFDADLTIWQPEETFTLTEEIIEHRHKVTPYLGKELSGKVLQTYVGGTLVYDNGKFPNLGKGEVVFK